jgi:hypothetical protein
MHFRKLHDSNQNISVQDNKTQEKNKKSTENLSNNPNTPQVDIRKLFENLQKLKMEIDYNIDKKNFVDAILLINKSLSMAKNFYQPDEMFV